MPRPSGACAMRTQQQVGPSFCPPGPPHSARPARSPSSPRSGTSLCPPLLTDLGTRACACRGDTERWRQETFPAPPPLGASRGLPGGLGSRRPAALHPQPRLRPGRADPRGPSTRSPRTPTPGPLDLPVKGRPPPS